MVSTMDLTLNGFYLSDDSRVDEALDLTGLSLDELTCIVGRFTYRSTRHGKLRGKITVKPTKVEIRHHFSNKKLWETSLDSRSCFTGNPDLY